MCAAWLGWGAVTRTPVQLTLPPVTASVQGESRAGGMCALPVHARRPSPCHQTNNGPRFPCPRPALQAHGSVRLPVLVSAGPHHPLSGTQPAPGPLPRTALLRLLPLCVGFLPRQQTLIPPGASRPDLPLAIADRHPAYCLCCRCRGQIGVQARKQGYFDVSLGEGGGGLARAWWQGRKHVAGPHGWPHSGRPPWLVSVACCTQRTACSPLPASLPSHPQSLFVPPPQ